MPKVLLNPALLCALIFVLSLCYYVYAALTLPTLFNQDNHLNYAATEYLVKHKKIPMVALGNNEIAFSETGTTRLTRPPFTFIVSAVAASLSEEIVDNKITRLRLGAPVIGAFTIVVIFLGFWLAFQHRGLALFGAMAIGLLPKFVFLASCNNDDIGAIFSVSCLLTCVIAMIRNRRKTGTLIALAFSVGLILQTKFTAWLVLPWFFVFCLIVLRHHWRGVLSLTPVLTLVMFIGGGWWLVLNMINYGVTDPLAIQHVQQLQFQIADVEPNRQGYNASGVGLHELMSNHEQFLSKSYRSLIGYLEWLDLDVGLLTYWFYALIFLAGVLGTLLKPWTILRPYSPGQGLCLVLTLIVISQCAFYVHHNLLRDIQPQARYILPVIMPLFYLFLWQIQQVPRNTMIVRFNAREYGFQTISATVLIAVCLIVHALAMQRSVIPTFRALPYFTNLQKAKQYSISEFIEITSATSMSHKFVGDALELQRTSSENSSVTLSSNFCEQLPLNALITMQVDSVSSGGINLHIDRFAQGKFENVYWRSVPVGLSMAAFVIDSRNCVGAKISFSRNTYKVTITELEISELKIHRYGKPL